MGAALWIGRLVPDGSANARRDGDSYVTACPPVHSGGLCHRIFPSPHFPSPPARNVDHFPHALDSQFARRRMLRISVTAVPGRSKGKLSPQVFVLFGSGPGSPQSKKPGPTRPSNHRPRTFEPAATLHLHQRVKFHSPGSIRTGSLFPVRGDRNHHPISFGDERLGPAPVSCYVPKPPFPLHCKRGFSKDHRVSPYRSQEGRYKCFSGR